MTNEMFRQFQELFAAPLRNGLTRPKSVRGHGVKMVNMGEIFAHRRIGAVPMDRVPLSPQEAANYVLRPGDLLFARQSLVLAGAGKCSIFMGDQSPVTFESHLIRARLNPRVADPLFYFYFFNSRAGQEATQSIVEQVAAAGIRGSDLARLLVPVPPLPEQRAIAHILGTLDDKIELNQRTSETLESTARAIFKSWFLDFDPVRAKAEGREPPGMDAETAALFPDRFEDSVLGKIPQGWHVRSLDQVANFLNGLAMQKFPPKDDKYLPVVKIAEMRRGNTTGSDRASAEIDKQYIVDDGDILFSWSGSLEVRIWTGGPGALNQHLFKVTSREYPKWFYYFWLKEYLPDFQAIASSKATTMGHIQRHHITEAKVAVPPQDLLLLATSVVDPLLSHRVMNDLESRTLANIRDVLLPKLMSGQIRVKHEEELTAAAP